MERSAAVIRIEIPVVTGPRRETIRPLRWSAATSESPVGEDFGLVEQPKCSPPLARGPSGLCGEVQQLCSTFVLEKRAGLRARRSARRRRRRFAPCCEQRIVREPERPSRLDQELPEQDAKLACRRLRLAVPPRAPCGFHDAGRGSRRCKQRLEREDGGIRAGRRESGRGRLLLLPRDRPRRDRNRACCSCQDGEITCVTGGCQEVEGGDMTPPTPGFESCRHR